MKEGKKITCDVCGGVIDPNDRVAIKGKRRAMKIFQAVDGDYFACCKCRFDMCRKCLDELKNTVKEKRSERNR